MRGYDATAEFGTDAEAAIAAAAKRYGNWNRWGPDDGIGTVNFIDADKRAEAARLVRRGESFSLSLPFDENGPQNGWRRRVNPVHTMMSTGQDTAEQLGLPHGLTAADDAVFMPLQCSTQWDGLGHVFDHGIAWNGRKGAEVVTSEGDFATGIERIAAPVIGRGVLLDVGRVLGEDGELPDGCPITSADLAEVIRRQGETSQVGRGDIVLVRTGQLSRVRRGHGWAGYAGGPAPGLSFETAGWLHGTQIAAIATDTWGFEVRPNEFPDSFQPLHQVALPHIGLLVGEMWDLDALAADCAADGVHEFFLAAQPLPFTRAVGSPVNPVAVK
ncbi:cyclase family protein [Actinomadura opuntiae]|uniref:cyclase family protein n=1 Tax=Actinomadura sp. OS1-43 TaxID=604315 RepID=UPI00255A9C70|nr:cyclase family protein [Actinomadura sp. OS1-43]MDL4817302.1 cyclase family protein [Actinomadura sp. OS1-43]